MDSKAGLECQLESVRQNTVESGQSLPLAVPGCSFILGKPSPARCGVFRGHYANRLVMS